MISEEIKYFTFVTIKGFVIPLNETYGKVLFKIKAFFYLNVLKFSRRKYSGNLSHVLPNLHNTEKSI